MNEAPLQTPTRRQLRLGCTLFAVIGILGMIYLQGPGLTSGSRYHGDLTQSPHWIAHHTDVFAEDDLLVEYATYNESPVQNAIYWVGTWFLDVVLLNKLVGIAIFGMTAALFFWLVSSTSGLRTGVLAACFLVIFPRSAYEIAGGFSKAWSIGLILVGLYVVETRDWRILVWVMPLAALAYPVAPVFIGAIVLTGILMALPQSFDEAVRGVKFLSAGSALALIPLLYKYLTPPDRIGEMISTSTMKEFWDTGINTTVTLPLWEEVLSYLEQPFYVYSAALLFMFLFRQGLVWKRSWSALVIASTTFYYLSDAVAPRLYLPDRYVRYSMAVLLILWFAHNWSKALGAIKGLWPHRVATVALLVFAVFSFSDTFKPCDGEKSLGVWEDRGKIEAVASVIASLPDPVLVAGHPYDLANIVVQARKPVLVIHRMFHPWFAGYYESIDSRNRDIFRAIYAKDVGAVNQLVEEYGVTHLLVESTHFSRSRVTRGNIYRSQYNDFVLDLVEAPGRFLLYPPPRDAVLFREDGYWLVELPLEQPGPRSGL
jgi:hypothetical protein